MDLLVTIIKYDIKGLYYNGNGDDINQLDIHIEIFMGKIIWCLRFAAKYSSKNIKRQRVGWLEETRLVKNC